MTDLCNFYFYSHPLKVRTFRKDGTTNSKDIKSEEEIQKDVLESIEQMRDKQG